MATVATDISVVVIPSRWGALVFESKAWGFRLQRLLHDAVRGRPPLHATDRDALADAPLLAEFRDGLWPADDADAALVAGKVQNLRLALRRLHGIEVAAGEPFSFWRQVGRASRARGYAQGRELREGCVIPAIGGGLCQLSNAIYDCAVRAGLAVVERHRHSRVIPGSLAEHDRDATVFWNYIDLRLSAGFPWRLEVGMSADELYVAIRGNATDAVNEMPLAVRRRDAQAPSGTCTSCERTQCHRHVGEQVRSTHRTWLVEDDWPEFRDYRKSMIAGHDRIVQPSTGLWSQLQSLRTRVVRRLQLWRGRPLPQARQRGLELLARDMGRHLVPDDLELLVPQSLLPYLWRDGVLAGRRFDVLMSALPMHAIQQRLDQAAARNRQSATLVDFRAQATLIQAERAALAQARHWITPHADIARMAGSRAVQLDWTLPPARRQPQTMPGDGRCRVLFCASPLARKGVFEFREAVAGLHARVLLPPGANESQQLWDGIQVQRMASYAEAIDQADIVVLPAWIEHQPRGLLQAIANGTPVIATPGCGLPDALAWHRVEAGDVEGLRDAIVWCMSSGKV